MTALSKLKAIKESCDRTEEGGALLQSTPSESTVEIPHRTDAVVRGLVAILKHHSARDQVITEIKQQLSQFLDKIESETVWIKHIKYILAYPLAKYLRNELPPAPDGPWAPTGLLRLWMKKRLQCYNRKNTHLWYSWFQAKRSSLPASKEIIQDTYNKHLKTLTRVDPGIEFEDTVDRILEGEHFNEVLNLIGDAVAEKFASQSKFTTFQPSRSASFEKSRSRLGSFGWLRELSGTSSDSYICIGPDELVSMAFLPKIYNTKRQCFEFNRVLEKRCPNGGQEWDELYPDRDRSRDERKISENLNCTIQGILEPMKVRVISKGEALPYYAVKPLQKAMNSILRRIPCFRLTGRSFDPTDMQDLARLAKPTDRWFSIDYSAATDGLSWEYAGAIFEQIIYKLPLEVKELARKVLGPHELWYPVEPGDPDIVHRGTMTNGQLMGSPLSFPILCLANLGVYLDVTDEVQRGWTLADRLGHVLVNGDDMVYAADPSLWHEHVRVAGQVGLEMSVGKAYLHHSYANINSTSIEMDLRKIKIRPPLEALDTSSFERSLSFIEKYQAPDVTPWKIDFLNVGLFFGQRKVQGNPDDVKIVKTSDEGVCKSCPLTSDEYFKKLVRKSDMYFFQDNGKLSSLPLLLEGTLPGRQRDILRQFLRMHREDVKEESTGVFERIGNNGRRSLSLFSRNLFFPISLGGMGIPTPPGKWNNKVKPIQRQICVEILRSRPGLGIASSHPLPGHPLQKVIDPAAPWRWVEKDSVIYTVRNKTDISHLRKKDRIGFIPYYEGICPIL